MKFGLINLWVLSMAVASGDAGMPMDDAALVASEGVPGLSIPVGTRARVVADHDRQGVTSPTALAFDEAGALYVAETHRFRYGVEDDRFRLYWYLDDLASQTLEDRAALLEKWREKAPLEVMTEKSELVRRLSEVGSDGVFAKSGVFAGDFRDQLDGTAAGVFAYEGTVFLANIPKIYALRDDDGDGVSDQRVVIQDGFGVRFSLSGHDANGFALSPDGRIYGTVGDRGLSGTTREGVSYEYPGQGLVFRFDPDGSNFEVVHTGLRNPKEIAFDELGNGIVVDNNSDQGDEARVVYVVEGADSGWRMGHQAMHTFHRQIGLEKRPPNRWMDERMWEMENEDQPAFMIPPVAHLTRGPSGLAYHPGTGFLESERGRFLICDYRGGASVSGLWSFKLAPSGAGMKMVDARRFNLGATATDVVYSWDGRVLVSDFMGGWESHEDGRIYELSAEKVYKAEQAAEAARLISEGFEQRESEELAKLLSHDDMRVRTRAELALTRKEDGLKQLAEVAKTGEGLARLHGIWGLGVIARRGGAALPVTEDFVNLPGKTLRELAFAELLPLLESQDSELKAQILKVLGEAGIAGDRINFGALLEDASDRVKLFAAIATGKTSAIGSLSFLWKMLEDNGDDDPYLRHAGSYAMAMLSKPRQLSALRSHPDASLRLAAVIALGRLDSEQVVAFLNDPDSRVADETVRVIYDRGIESVLPQVAALLSQQAKGKRSEMIWRRLLHSAYRLGDAPNIERVVTCALDEKLPLAVRREALRLLRVWNKPHPVDQFLGRHAPLPERDAAIAKAALQPQVKKWLGLEGELLEAGIDLISSHQLDDSSVSTDQLRVLVDDLELPGAARAKVLKLYVARKPDAMIEYLFGLVEDSDDLLALAVIGELAGLDLSGASKALAHAVESDSTRRQQEAWKIVGGLKQASLDALIVEGLEELVKLKGQSAAGLELLATARQSEGAEVKKALAAYEAMISASDDPLAEWQVTLHGGDVSRGEQLFASHPGGQCMRCHSDDGEHGSGSAGPDLAGVGKRGDREYFLQSLILPGERVVAGFGMVTITLRDGTVEAGNLIEEAEDSVLIDVARDLRRIPRSEIIKMSEAVSVMPAMVGVLDPKEIRDLIEWLSTRK